MAKGAGHQVSPPRARRRKSKERGRGDMEGEGGGACRPLLFSSPLPFFPPSFPLSGFPPSSYLSIPFSHPLPPFRPVIFRWRKWEVKGEQEAACNHLCAVKTFLFYYPPQTPAHKPHPTPLSLAWPSKRRGKAVFSRHPDGPPLSRLLTFLAVLRFLSVMDVCGSGGPRPLP